MSSNFIVVLMPKHEVPLAFTKDGYSVWEIADSLVIKSPKARPGLQEIINCKTREEVEELYKKR